MKEFQINVITRKTFEDESFICPNCLSETPFEIHAEPIEKPMRFRGSTASCIHCDDAYLVLNEESIPGHNLVEIKNQEPIVILSSVEYIQELLKY